MKTWFAPRFSLRALVILTLVCGVGLGVYAAGLHRARRQAPAVALLREMGATVLYDGDVGKGSFQLVGGGVQVVERPSPYPKWAIDALGVDFFHNVTKVKFQCSLSLPHADRRRFWHAISQLPTLTHLEASGGVNAPGWIQLLAHHQSLESLKLSWADLMADDCKVFHKLGGLKELNLSESRITDHGLAEIARSNSLECLDLHHTRITDDGLYKLAFLPSLKRLWMSGTSVGDRGLAYLRGHPTLIDLDLCNTKITDQSLAHAASIPNLAELDVSQTDISDDGLAQLAGHPRLAYLNLSSSEVRGPGLATLEKLPSLRELCVGGFRFEGDLSLLRGCSSLKCLSVSGQSMVDRRIPITELPPNLEELFLDAFRVTDATLMGLVNVPQLRRIRYSEYGDDLTLAVKEFRKLRPDCALEEHFFYAGQRHGLRSRP